MARVTLDMVAQRAGVAKATVSLILNGRAKELRISEATQKRVWESMEALNYRVNVAARSTRHNRTHCFGVVSLRGGRWHPIFGEQVEGVERAALERDYYLVLMSLSETDLLDAQPPKLIRENLVEGLVFLLAGRNTDNLDTAVRRYKIPSVWIQRDQPTDAVKLNEHAFGLQAGEYLMKLGHKRIAYIDHSPGTFWSRDRRLGLTEAMSKAGLTPRLIDTLRVSMDEAMAFYRALLSEPNRPTALLQEGDRDSGIAMQAARSLNLEVPRDLSVIPVGNGFQEFGIYPRLTRWQHDLAAVGHAAATMLINKIENEGIHTPTQELCGKIVEGLSTGPLGV